LMSCAYETFLVARPIIAILGPNWVYVIPVIPPSFGSSGCTRCRSTQAHAKGFWQHPRPPTHHCYLLQWWSSIGGTL